MKNIVLITETSVHVTEDIVHITETRVRITEAIVHVTETSVRVYGRRIRLTLPLRLLSVQHGKERDKYPDKKSPATNRAFLFIL